MRLVILPIGARAREGDLLVLTVTQQFIVYELAAVIGVQTEQRKRQGLPGGMDRSSDIGLASAQQSQALRPSRGNIRQNQRVEKGALGSVSAMRDQVSFHKTGGDLVPVGKRSNRDFVLQEFSRPRRRNRPAFRMPLLV